ncbi:serine/threonine-protein phosphatase 7 long form-like protein [Cucumis melo var. makuwa]|uniref:Serine/threonine-protein phosphatase 7 long form-like protein n=2 Tax=Cucumis melo TaxID=3656 RepID=A0A5D3B9Y5_CUCMM|nr:serine/threonine-protein phosphatase 7 long form-like protein [Cucumis melo var. makuwa]TYJ95937.1 serine/threonine-protein phosphatase 7 long form-like protein [Cucumis melo var. makuwa]
MVGCCSADGLPVNGEPLAGSLSLPWLAEQFQELPPDSDVAGMYAWGTATLAWLYRELCRISYYRAIENATGFRWSTFEFQTSYLLDIMAPLPVRCRSGQVVWTYVGPMICFHLVKKHQPDRVLRQFNMSQMPPAISFTDPSLHQIDLRASMIKIDVEFMRNISGCGMHDIIFGLKHSPQANQRH